MTIALPMLTDATTDDTDTTPEILHAATTAVVAALDSEHPMPATLAVDMLQDAGAEDRTDAVFHLFQATAAHLLGLLGSESILTPGDSFNIGAQAYQIAWQSARQCCDSIRGQVVPTRTRDDLARNLKLIPGLASTGIAWTIRRQALERWADTLALACEFLMAIEAIEAIEGEEITPVSAGATKDEGAST